MKKSYLILIGALALGLAGCYEPADITVHEPGVYKGDKDPLLNGDASKRNEQLMARFNQGQRDR